jgi:mannosyl-3-phosphoglycerate phosphatase
MSKKSTPGTLIFTDLDGTLLDHESYSWKPAEPALKLAGKMKVPVIICSSKTRAEIEVYRKKLRNGHPFIAENGEGIFIPSGYFKSKPPGSRKRGSYDVITLGKPYGELRKVIMEMRKKGFGVRGFGDMSVQELSDLTGLTREQAALARKREFDEPFVLEDPGQEPGLRDFIGKRSLQVTRGGRFFHLLGSNNKGLAVELLSGIYSHEAGVPVVTAGLGDSPNDFTLLRAVHVPFLLMKKGGGFASSSKAFRRINRPGPEGWNLAVREFLEEGI